MDRETYWKNFSLGTELEVAGSFIYNGLWTFHEMNNFSNEAQVFEFFYNIAVGVERIAKVTIILLEHNDITDQQEFEEELRTHNHAHLIERIADHKPLHLSREHHAFIEMLRVFYDSIRYGRYSLESIRSHALELDMLVSFISNYLEGEVDTASPFVSRNNTRIKRYVGRIIGKVCNQLYEIIDETATRLNMYTYEISYFTKAYKIFTRHEYDFIDEDLAWTELLIYLLNTDERSAFLNVLKGVEPLELDAELIQDYIISRHSPTVRCDILDAVDSQYEEFEDKEEMKNRLSLMQALNSPGVMFMDDDEEQDEEV
ncbi:hypothetical protein [Alicyclobacillus ferrooxydans]|uniref:Uncharacterized protein n=1 Tax=Alicyclobacillus ferrooxydans TaxID=471514 RepID=A0A0P9CLE1_9BACL|nr:hypothetical protein [Alicyclobacillus ferrooxydans]KPV43822.1 hypothetical protein AN477_10640 [Alicyclobacillus ferrooxydans]